MADFNWESLIGPGLGLAGSLFNRNQTNQTANQYYGMGQPYRERLEATYANPNAYMQSPEVQAAVKLGSGNLARTLSATEGNPFGSGHAQQELQNYATQKALSMLGEERNRLFNYGGGAYFNQAAPQARSGAQGANMGVFNALSPLMTILGNYMSGSGGIE